MQQNWVAIFGKIEYVDDTIRHIPTPLDLPTDLSGQPASPHSLVRSNIEFEQGTITFEAKLADPDARCQVGLAGPASTEIFAGLNIMGASYGFGVFRDGQWQPGGGTGYGDKPPVDEWMTIGLTVRGSNLSLRFNDVLVASSVQRVQKGPLSLLFQSNHEILVRDFSASSKPPECFVVMQFTEEFNALYSEVIKPTCEKFGYQVVRADDFYSSGLIIEDITRSISESAVVIADVTPNNPNVFYEVGYAHGIGKPTILLSDRKRDRLPFDISGFRTLFYDNTIGGKSVVEERLTKHLEGIGA